MRPVRRRLVSLAEPLEHRLLLSTGTFGNPGFITIRDDGDGSASPYPSTINVSGLSGTITDMTVTLSGFGHGFPKDVDMLLVAPDATQAVIFSDVGAGFSVSGLTITLDDAAPNSLPDSSALSSGTFRPTNVNGNDGDQFPAPAPTAVGNSALSSFDGINPNGTWKLFVYDDAPEFAGQITNGWSMTITTSGGAGPSVPSTPSLDSASDTGNSSSDGITNDNTPTFLGTADAGAVVHLLDGSTEVGSATANGSGIWSIATSALTDGPHSIVAYATSGGGTSGNSAAASVTIDTVAPTITAPTAFNYLTAPQRVLYRFSENVGPSFTVNAITLSNVASAQMSTSYGDSNVGVVTFPGFTSGVLPDGTYTATLDATKIKDIAGNALAGGNDVTSFFVLSADANHDGTVDTLDFNAMAANFGKTGVNYSQADFNYDNVVDTLDFNTLAANFGKHLSEAAPPAVAANMAAAVPIRVHRLFGDVLVDASDAGSLLPG